MSNEKQPTDLNAIVEQQKTELLNALSQKDQAQEKIDAARNTLVGLKAGLDRESELRAEIDALMDEQKPTGTPSQ